MIEQSINNLNEYIEKDEIYQMWENGTLENASDFDQFCINHCCDIKNVLDKISNLTKECDDLRQKVNNAIEYLQTKECLMSLYSIKNNESYEVKKTLFKILGGNNE